VADSDLMVEFVGGSIDGDRRYIGSLTHDYFVPVPLQVAIECPESDEPSLSRLLVQRYERRVFVDELARTRITKMVFVGEEWR
jgi:hypothetical protein